MSFCLCKPTNATSPFLPFSLLPLYSNYFLANAVLELILTTTCALVYGVLTYFLCFYASSGDFAFDWGTLFLFLFCLLGKAGGKKGKVEARDIEQRNQLFNQMNKHTGKFAIYLIFVVAGAHTGSMQAIMCAILSPSLEIACALNVGITCVFCFGGIPPRLLFAPSRIIQVRVFVVCVYVRARSPPSLPAFLPPLSN